jgi:hypothetical protein
MKHRHDTGTYDYVELCYFLKLLPVSTCQCLCCPVSVLHSEGEIGEQLVLRDKNPLKNTVGDALTLTQMLGQYILKDRVSSQPSCYFTTHLFMLA